MSDPRYSLVHIRQPSSLKTPMLEIYDTVCMAVSVNWVVYFLGVLGIRALLFWCLY